MLDKFKYFLILLFVMFMSCRSNKDTIPRNLEMIYNPASSTIHPAYRVYNTSDTSSVIAGKIKDSELLFNQANQQNKLLSRLEIKYQLYDLSKKERLVDSAVVLYNFEKDVTKSYRYFEIPFYGKIGNNYILEIVTSDLNRKSKQFSFLHVDRTNLINCQDFNLRNKFNDELILNRTYKNDTNIVIEHYKQSFDSLNVFYFTNEYDIPQPPVESEVVEYNFVDYDSSWVVYTDSFNYKSFFDKGLYYLTTETEPVNGFALLNFGEEFPRVVSPKDLLEPLKYFGVSDTVVTDSTERYRKLMVDNFWLERANNINKSRELLQLFYNRVMFANLYFTSFLEGWKTDRGMIYIIYGKPDYVFKSDEEEKWIYNPVDLGPGYSFTFKYYKNPFSLNHFVLDREKLKSTGWSDAIQIWESGEVNYYQY